MEDLNSRITELIIKYQNGDTDAFTGIYEGSYKLVYTTCFGMLHNEDDAQDMTQEVFIRIYEKLNTLDEPRAYGRWMKMLATNMCLNHIKKTGRMNEHLAEDDVDLDLAAGEWEAFDSLPDSFIEDEEKREIINKVLKESLSEVQYQTIFMHYFGEMQLTDIARQMDCPEGTVKTRLMKAKARFKDALSKYVDDNKLVLSAVPFMTRFLEAGMSRISIPLIPLNIPQIPVSSSPLIPVGTPKIAAASANSGAKVGFFSTAAGKITIGGIALLGVAAVGIGAFVALNKKDTPVDNTKESTYVSGTVNGSGNDKTTSTSGSSADTSAGEYETKYLMVKKTENGKDILFEYDEYGRKVKETRPNVIFNYEYDEFNNRIKTQRISVSTGEEIDNVVYENTYDEQHRLIRHTGTNSKGYVQSDGTYKYEGDELVYKEYYDCSGNTDDYKADTTTTEEYKNGLLMKGHPSFYQFRYFYRKTRSEQNYLISRKGLTNYQRNYRPLLGEGTSGYAQNVGVAMLDSTICDIYLVDEVGNLLGRPILTACVDAYSQMCFGFALTWEGRMKSLRELM